MPDSQHEPREVAVRPQEQLLIDALDAFSPRQVLCTSQGVAQLAAAAVTVSCGCRLLPLSGSLSGRKSPAAHGPWPGKSQARMFGRFSAASRRSGRAAVQCPGRGGTYAGFIARGAPAIRARRHPHHQHRQPQRPLVARRNAEAVCHGNPPRVVAGHVLFCAARSAVAAHQGLPLQLRLSRSRSVDSCRQPARRLLASRSRPGARQLMAAMEIAAGDRVLDMGCGSGTVSLAAAFRAEGVVVASVDSHARAVECTALGTIRNGLENIQVEHSARGPEGDPQTFDIVVANPPYYAGFRIARFFLETAHAALRPAAGSSLSASSPSGTPSTCHSGSTRLRSSPRRAIGSREGGGVGEPASYCPRTSSSVAQRLGSS